MKYPIGIQNFGEVRRDGYAVIQTPDYVYILELKIDKTATEALQQIRDRGYATPFEGDGRRVFLIGMNFDTATRRIDDWTIA